MAKKNENEGQSLIEAGKAYFESHPLYLGDSIFVAEDGTIFPGSLKGRNAADNYCKDKTGANGTMSYTEIQR